MTVVPGAWYPDPTGRHDHRWWDGLGWTDHVADAGVPASDAYLPLPPPPAAGLGLASGSLTVTMTEQAYGHWPVLDAAGEAVGWAVHPRLAPGPPTVRLTDAADQPVLQVVLGPGAAEVFGPQGPYGRVGFPVAPLSQVVAQLEVRGTVRARLVGSVAALVAGPVPVDSQGGPVADLQVGRFDDGVGWLTLQRRMALTGPLDALVLALPLAVALEMAGRVALRGAGRRGETPGSPWPGL